MSSLAAQAELQARVASPGRSTCYRCFRPTPLCYCERLEQIPNRTRVVIVQHPREQFHPINTARMVEGSLQQCEVLRGPLRTLGQRFAALHLPQDTALLYPSADAVDLADIPQPRCPSTVVVLDGTWHQAKTLLRDLPELAQLPRVRFTPEAPSEYRIRKEPHLHCLSTLESVVLVLARIEPALDVTPLTELFREVIDRNIAARKPTSGEGRFRWRGRGKPFQLPDSFREPLHESVVMYAESARSSVTLARSPRPMVVVGQRLEDGAELRLWLKADDLPSERLLAHLGQTPEGFASQAIAAGVARERLENFVGKRRVVCFHPSTIALLEGLGLAIERETSLKGTYCDWKRAQPQPPERWGSLDEICVRERLSGPSDAGAGGRPALRTAQTLALWTFLRTQAALPSR